MDLQLQGKTAIVTGGAKGIGEAIVRSLCREGVRVVIADRNPGTAGALIEDLTKSGGAAICIPTELTDLKACQKTVGKTLEWSDGSLDILVNNAGVNDGVGLDAGPDKFLASLHKNIVHVYALAHHALDALKASRGTIINITSKVAETGQGGTSGYAASKGAMNGLTREWAVDLAPHGIRVNTVAPAEVMTPLYRKWLETLPDPDETLRHIEAQIPLGKRMTTKEEIADLVAFLASPCSGHTTGQILYPDGGYVHLDRSCTSALNKD